MPLPDESRRSRALRCRKTAGRQVKRLKAVHVSLPILPHLSSLTPQ
jgi:hypothetical protein